MFKKPFSFNGRIRRLEYGLTRLIYVAVIVGLVFVTQAIETPIVFIIAILPLLWFEIAQGAKRCHDLGNSGWYQLIPFYNIVMLFYDSRFGENEYGLNPKGIGNMDEIDQLGKEQSA